MTLGAFRTSAGVLGGSTTPQAPITVPRGGGTPVQNTDWCLLACFAGGGVNASAAPDGSWATIKPDTLFNVGGSRYALYSKVIGTDTTITPAWPTAPASGANTASLALFFSGINGSEALGTPNYPTTADGIATCSGTTTQGPDRTVLAITACRGQSTGFASAVSWAAGFTPIASLFATGTFAHSISAARLDKPVAGSTADQTATWNLATLNIVGIQLALTPSVLSLAVSLDVLPNNGSFPLGITATASSSGGNANPKTYSMVWGDGQTSGSQSSTVFTHTYAAVGEYDPVVTVNQP